MHLRKLLIAVVVVGALCALAWWRARLEPSSSEPAERPLLEGFDRSRVRALRVDNVERSLQLRIERNARDEWNIVDPLEFPAENAVVQVLLESLATQHGKPAAGVDASKVSLAPPRAVLEIEEDVGGSLLKRRVEIGAIDLDPTFAFVRVDGQILRTERALDTTLDRDLHDWRSRSLWTVFPKDIVEVRRQGSVLLSAEQVARDLTFAAVLDGNWRATAPFSAQLDPDAFLRWLVAASTMRAQFFIDSPGALVNYGLDPAPLRIDLAQADGKSESLLLAPEPQGELWYAARVGSPHVYRVGGDTVLSIAPPSAMLLDREMVRLVTESVDRLELACDGKESVLRRTERGWRITGKRDGVVVVDGDPADAQLVLDAIAALERSRYDDFLFDANWSSSESRGYVRVGTADDLQGGEFGPAYRTRDGIDGVCFRRLGDQLVSLVSHEVEALAQRDPLAWRSLELHKIPELEVARIEFSFRGGQRAYAREDKGKWVRMGTTSEAKEFAKLVDGLLAMRAVELGTRTDQALTDELVVRIQRYSGAAFEFSLGQWNDAGTPRAVYRSSERFAQVRPELAAGLRLLFADG